MQGLDALTKAKSIAIVGVSKDNTKLGTVILSNLTNSGFMGQIYPVNPKYEELFGLKAYPTVQSIPGEVDLVCIVIPKQFVKEVLESCGKKGVKAVIIITSGFSEIDDAGKMLEQEIAEIAKQRGIRILGPNCLGVISPFADINLSFAASYPDEGNIAFLSQSGAFCTAVLDKAVPENLGFSHFISMGNTADINETDLLPYFHKDEKVKVIAAYLEEIVDGSKLLEQYKSVADPKPLLLFKSGRSDEAKLAVQSHTGSIAGRNETFDTATAQNGIISVSSMRSFYNLMKGFSWSKLPKGNRIAIVTNAGGPGIIATDAVVESGLKMAELSGETEVTLRSILPETANTRNPVDVGGDALADRFKGAIDGLIVDPGVDAVLVILSPQYITQIEETAKLIANVSKVSEKPIIPVFLGEEYASLGRQRLSDQRIVVYEDIEDAIEVFTAMYTFHVWKNREKKDTPKYVPNAGAHRAELEKYVTDEPSSVPDELAAKMMAEVGINLPEQRFCTKVEEAIEFAQGNFPVVLKVPNFFMPHKVDVKGIILNIKDEAGVREAYSKLMGISTDAGKHPEQLLVQKQLKTREELIIGTNRDGGSDVYGKGGGFGHLVMFGKGGIYTEIYDDHSYVLLPATREHMLRAISETKVSKILSGARGQGALEVSKLIETMENIQTLLLTYPEIVSLDINPLFIDETDVTAVDVKMFVGR